MKFPEARLIVFAKAPIPGWVKTRLIAELGAEGAAQLHLQLVRHSLSTAIHAGLCQVQLWCAPHKYNSFFNDCHRAFHIDLFDQEGRDLGERMKRAFEQALKESPYVVLIGTDCPVLDKAYLHQALEALQKGADVVLGPAEDGGYVLIGLRRYSEVLFEGIQWGSDSVFAETEARIRKLKWKYVRLQQRWDVDRPADISRLMSLLFWQRESGK